MSKASLEEWQEIHRILGVFCGASGLLINVQKSTFLHYGVAEDTLDNLKEVFQYNFIALSEGFRYLGYFLKPDSYKVEDWHWLISKFEKRINLWCNRWLSIGGRYVLIKVVLEGQPVYWMAMAHIPSSMLNRIRQLVFSFLWTGGKQKQSYHLCKWEIIARPKRYGGWGLRNLYSFYRALTTNTLWRVLMKRGIWQRVIKDKYLPFGSVTRWLRSTESFSVAGITDLENSPKICSSYSTLDCLEPSRLNAEAVNFTFNHP
jgi:hypothetical protein